VRNSELALASYAEAETALGASCIKAGLRALTVGAAFLVTSVVNPAVAAILSGSVSYDPEEGYTYSYVIDNRGALTPIWELSILFYRDRRPDNGIEQPKPPNSITNPDGWVSGISFSGNIAEPPYNMLGSFYYWYGWPNVVSSGELLSGFSFTVPKAPQRLTGKLQNNYFLYGNTGIIEFGNVVAPDINTPLPGAFPLFASVLGLGGWLGWRRKWSQNQPAPAAA
jgi:hypothetical protein